VANECTLSQHRGTSRSAVKEPQALLKGMQEDGRIGGMAVESSRIYHALSAPRGPVLVLLVFSRGGDRRGLAPGLWMQCGGVGRGTLQFRHRLNAYPVKFVLGTGLCFISEFGVWVGLCLSHQV